MTEKYAENSPKIDVSFSNTLCSQYLDILFVTWAWITDASDAE